MHAQINTNRVMLMGRNALYYEDYVLSIQRFNYVISAKPYLAEPYFYRGLAKFYLEDYTGAEADLTSAITRNPYAENYYVLRGLCRIHLKFYDRAEEDYQKAININPIDDGYWHNMVLCQMEQKTYSKADSCLDLMIKHWPKLSENYTMKAQVSLAQKDTVKAEKWVDRALDVNGFDGSALSMKAMLLLNRHKYPEGEAMLDKAIVQLPRQTDLYVNRALARYNQDNLRGAMSDYDAALELNANNYVAHFNRGLLRAQVGDDNHAIEDFNFVIQREPDNYIAIYNRAILHNNVGQYQRALTDLSTIIREYPEFWDGYSLRASIRRKIGDVYGAERDEFKVMKARIEGVHHKKTKKTRKKEDRNLDDYNQLVENTDQEPVKEYASEYRGKIQNRQAELAALGMFVLSYYEPTQKLSGYEPYMTIVEQLNRRRSLGVQLYLTNVETTASESTVNSLFDDINYLTDKMTRVKGHGAMVLLRRAFDYYHVRDFESGIVDMDTLISREPSNQIALFLRAQLRFAQLKASHVDLQKNEDKTAPVPQDVRVELNHIAEDLKSIIVLSPNQSIVHYNLGNVYILLHDYDLAADAFTQALTLDATFPDAYFNRGVAYILQGKRDKGLADLSQAGELGLYSAYSLIKHYSNK